MDSSKFSLIPEMDNAVNAQSDLFGRDEFRDQIINLYKNCEDPLVVALDEPWGSGKTVFAKRLKNKISKDEEIQAIYFDAFENDHEEEVFIAIASVILSALNIDDSNKRAWEATKSVAKVLGRLSLKASARLLTAGALSSADLSEAGEEVAEEISNIAEGEFDKLIDSKLKNFAQDKFIFQSFRKILAEKASEKPLVVIIDELDRCRPTYALAVLETIKHLFSVRGVHFFLVSNSVSLVASIEHEYGNVDGYAYLQKFISLRLSFPRSEEWEQKNQINKFVANSLKGKTENSGERQIFTVITDFITDRFLKHGYSLRALEKLIIQTKLSFLFSSPNENIFPPIFVILIDLKLFNPLLYDRAKSNKITYLELASYYGFSEIISNDEVYSDRIASTWYFLLTGINDDEWHQFSRQLLTFSDENRRDVISHAIRNVVEILPDE